MVVKKHETEKVSIYFEISDILDSRSIVEFYKLSFYRFSPLKNNRANRSASATRLLVSTYMEYWYK